METNEIDDIIDDERPEPPAHIREEAWAWQSGWDAGFRAAAARTFDQQIDAAPPADDRLVSLMTEPVIVDAIDQ